MDSLHAGSLPMLQIRLATAPIVVTNVGRQSLVAFHAEQRTTWTAEQVVAGDDQTTFLVLLGWSEVAILLYQIAGISPADVVRLDADWPDFGDVRR
jgi:hypothetical protein